MTGKVFIDTNVLIYVYSKTEKDKKAIALEILKNPCLTINTQVVNEFVWVMSRKYSVPMAKLEKVVIKFFENFEVTLITKETIGKALSISQSHRYSYWDSLIIASALESGCSVLYTEDMQHGQVIENRFKIINPFR